MGVLGAKDWAPQLELGTRSAGGSRGVVPLIRSDRLDCRPMVRDR